MAGVHTCHTTFSVSTLRLTVSCRQVLESEVYVMSWGYATGADGRATHASAQKASSSTYSPRSYHFFIQFTFREKFHRTYCHCWLLAKAYTGTVPANRYRNAWRHTSVNLNRVVGENSTNSESLLASPYSRRFTTSSASPSRN